MNAFRIIFNYLNDFICLLYPKICTVCGEHLLKNENILCTKCMYHIPRTQFNTDENNPVSQMFWGRIAVQHAMSYFYYRKGSKYQSLIHNLKYKGQKEIGLEMGKLLGLEISQLPWHNEVDVIIPVPLHPKRERKRGYNQSEWIAKGISSVIKKPIEKKVLFRTVYSETQTQKTRYQRWENVSSIFTLKNEWKIKDKHILLVDDVITTGATVEACTGVLLNGENVKVSIASLGMTN